jgi:hypothetical protein
MEGRREYFVRDGQRYRRLAEAVAGNDAAIQDAQCYERNMRVDRRAKRWLSWTLPSTVASGLSLSVAGEAQHREKDGLQTGALVVSGLFLGAAIFAGEMWFKDRYASTEARACALDAINRFNDDLLLQLQRGRYGIEELAYEDTEHYQITRDFLASPEHFFRHLFSDEEEP